MNTSKFWTNTKAEQSQILYKSRIQKKFKNPNEH